MFERGVFDVVAQNNLEGLSRFSVLTHLSLIPPRLQAFSALGDCDFLKGHATLYSVPVFDDQIRALQEGDHVPSRFLSSGRRCDRSPRRFRRGP